MSAKPNIPDTVRLIVEQQGLQRALELFPATVIAAAERGLRPLTDRPGGFAPVTPPATALDPSRTGGGE